MINPRHTVLVVIVLSAALSRLLPHPPNLTAMTAVALFAGAYFADKRFAFFVPLAALFVSDLFLGLHSQIGVVYLAFALIVGIGLLLRKCRTVTTVAGAAVTGSVLFFIVTNLGVWLFDGMYPWTWEGLAACYIAALPFFRNMLIGDLLYTALLFGGFALLEMRFPALRQQAS